MTWNRTDFSLCPIKTALLELSSEDQRRNPNRRLTGEAFLMVADHAVFFWLSGVFSA